MIHRRKGRKLKRTASHRKALLSNLSVSLIKHKKIKTTLAKAKELRGFVESVITKSKKAFNGKSERPEYDVHLRREANKFLNDKSAIKELFDEIAPKVVNRPGGYTRVLKLGRRIGDNAELAIIELVDYNLESNQTKEEGTSKTTKKTTKSKKKSSTKSKKTDKSTAKKPKKEEAA